MFVLFTVLDIKKLFLIINLPHLISSSVKKSYKDEPITNNLKPIYSKLQLTTNHPAVDMKVRQQVKNKGSHFNFYTVVT